MRSKDEWKTAGGGHVRSRRRTVLPVEEDPGGRGGEKEAVGGRQTLNLYEICVFMPHEWQENVIISFMFFGGNLHKFEGFCKRISYVSCGRGRSGKIWEPKRKQATLTPYGQQLLSLSENVVYVAWNNAHTMETSNIYSSKMLEGMYMCFWLIMLSVTKWAGCQRPQVKMPVCKNTGTGILAFDNVSHGSAICLTVGILSHEYFFSLQLYNEKSRIRAVLSPFPVCHVLHNALLWMYE